MNDRSSSAPLPAMLALVDDDTAFSEYLAQFLQLRGIVVRWFADSDDLLCSERPFDHDFYIVDLMLPGVDGLSLLRLLRKRTQAGVLVVSGKLASDLFDQVIGAGADMLLAKPVSFEQIALAVSAVYRRSAGVSRSAPLVASAWRLDETARRLQAPDGAVVDLSPTDVSVLTCLLEAQGETVGHEALALRLGLSHADEPNLLHATLYRLRRRIERATSGGVPLKAKSRVGYAFTAPLERA